MWRYIPISIAPGMQGTFCVYILFISAQPLDTGIQSLPSAIQRLSEECHEFIFS